MSKSAKFLKWAGSKVSSLDRILPALHAGDPAFEKGRYYEPFLGGGAVFFTLQPRWAVLSDVNKSLIGTYIEVKCHPEMVIRDLKEMKYARAEYERRRAEFNKRPTAAGFIYLNRTCFNGLYRVNKSGEFNVPFGRYTNPTICDEAGLREASEALCNTSISCVDFEVSLRAVQKGDRVYVDPPYTPVSDTANFTAYTKGGFGPKDQLRLSVAVMECAHRKALVVVSAADTPEVRKLYPKKYFDLEELRVKRAINSNASKRGAVGELLITPKKSAF